MTDSAVSNLELWRYSLFAIPIAFAGFPLYVLAPDYFATTHGVSLTLLGLLLLGLRLFDAFQDPLIGVLSDHHRAATPWFMGVSAILLSAAMYGLFNLLPVAPALWFAICVAVAVTAYSVLSINLNTLGGLWTKDPAAQTRIAARREACGLVGLVIAVSLPALLAQLVGEEHVYVYFSLILAGCMLLAWVLFRPWLAQHVVARAASEQKPLSLFAGLRTTSRATRLFLGIYGLSMLASAIPAVLVIFFVRDLLGAEQMMGLFLLLYFLSGALTMPLWRTVSRRLGKYHAWAVSMLLAVAGFIWAFFLGEGDIWQYAAICAVSGLALGADLALPPSILADHIHARQAEEHAASHYALLALIAKLSLALASAIALPLLAEAGFAPGVPNTQDALFALSAAYALIPCVLKLAAALLLFRLFLSAHQGDIYEPAKTYHPDRSTPHA
jgi:Na+/melibiose symporter-like transporter